MKTTRSMAAGILAGVSLMMATAAFADDNAAVAIELAYPNPQVAVAGETIDVEVSVRGLESFKECALSVPSSSADQCALFQDDYGCDAAIWNADAEQCELSLCWCVAAVRNEIHLPAPFSLYEEPAGTIHCTLNVPGWEGTFVPGAIIGAETLNVDLLGDAIHSGVPMETDERGNISAKLFTCKVDIAANVETGQYVLDCAEGSSTDPAGAANFTQCGDGIIQIIGATPTSTPVPTATATPRRSSDGGDCAVVSPVHAGGAWLLLLPAAALLWLRRSSR
jgi:hypothetical protein